MKITIKKEYTTLAQLPQVKADIKEFKARYTDGDLKNAFESVTETTEAWCADIVYVNIEAFPGGTVYKDETQFSVDMLCEKWREFVKIHFYCDMDLTINTGDLMDYRGFSTGEKMYSVERYVLQA